MQAPTPTSLDPRRIGIIAAAVAGVILVLLALAQVFLPGMAESRVRDQIKGFGPNPDVEVKAFPAVKLLFHKADEVTVHMDSARATGSSSLADQIIKTNDVDELHVRVGRLTAGPLIVRDARLEKESSGRLVASATVRDADLTRAIPSFLDNVRPAKQQEAGGGLVLEGDIQVPIVGNVHANARVAAEQGGIVARPEGIPFLDQIASLTIFADPRVLVQSVGATQRPGGFSLSASGKVVGE